MSPIVRIRAPKGEQMSLDPLPIKGLRAMVLEKQLLLQMEPPGWHLADHLPGVSFTDFGSNFSNQFIRGYFQLNKANALVR
jgi:hypothetical protein